MHVDELNDELVMLPIDSEVFVEVDGTLYSIESIEDDSQGVSIKINKEE